MKYQIGDKVLILHSDEEAEVIDIINDKMMLVDVDGVKFPVYMDQVDFPYFKRFSEKKTTPPPKEKQYVDDLKKEKTQPQVADGMWLTFLPVMYTDVGGDEVVKELKMHLVNRTNDEYHFKYRQSFFGKQEFTMDNQLHPFEDFYLHDMPLTDLSDSPVFEFEFSLLQPEKTKAPYHAASVKLKPKQLFDRIGKMRINNEATFSYRLFEKYPDRQVIEAMHFEMPANKAKIYDAAKGTQHMEPALSVVDLHIEKLSDNPRALNNFEMLSLQLKTFEKYFELALLHRQRELIVIHGVGEGKLRDEVHDILRLKKEVKSFVNQYHPLYGFGATEILFQY